MNAREYLKDTEFKFEMLPICNVDDEESFNSRKLWIALNISFKNTYTQNKYKEEKWVTRSYRLAKADNSNKTDYFQETVWLLGDPWVLMTIDEYKNRLDELKLLAQLFFFKFKKDFIEKTKFIEDINNCTVING
jgi:hypothetical protein